MFKNNILHIKFFVILIFVLIEFIYSNQTNQVNVGYAGNLSGYNSFENVSFIEGASLFFNNLDSNKLNFYINDTRNNNLKFNENTIELVNNKDYYYLFGFEDNASLISILPFICLNNHNLFFPLGGSDILYKYPNNQYVFMKRKSYTDEIKNLASYIIKNNYKNIGVIYELNHVGVEMYKSFSSYLTQHGKNIDLSSGYNLNQFFLNNISDYSTLFLGGELDLIVLLANSEVSKTFIQNIRSSGSGVDIALLSLANFNRIKDLLIKKDNLFSNLIFSDIYDFNMKQLYFYDEFMTHFSSSYNSSAYGGFISAKLFDSFLTFKSNKMYEDKLLVDIFDLFKHYLKVNSLYHHYFSEQFYLVKVNQYGDLKEVNNAY